MAYMRGHYYLWSDGEELMHVWSADGYDAWDNTGWACDENNRRSKNREHASGVSLPVEIMDQYVVMRMAELVRDGKVEEIIDKCLGPEGQSGNVGSMVLEKNAEQLKKVLSQIRLEEPDPL